MMVHFAHQILRCLHHCIDKYRYMYNFFRTGPLVSSWCMRMEAKHNWFKKIAQIGNFKNIALSLARRHQRLMCLYLNQEDFFGNHPIHGPSLLLKYTLKLIVHLHYVLVYSH